MKRSEIKEGEVYAVNPKARGYGSRSHEAHRLVRFEAREVCQREVAVHRPGRPFSTRKVWGVVGILHPKKGEPVEAFVESVQVVRTWERNEAMLQASQERKDEELRIQRVVAEAGKRLEAAFDRVGLRRVPVTSYTRSVGLRLTPTQVDRLVELIESVED